MNRDRLRAKLPWFALAAGCLAGDLWSKHLVFYPHVLDERTFRPGMAVGRVTSWWNTILVYNEGVTFGMLSGVSVALTAALTSCVIAWMAWRLWKLPAGRPGQATSLAMIVGGAVGNLYDRALRPALEPDRNEGVRDFLDWHIPEDWGLFRTFQERGWKTNWYTSNVADVLIVCGVVVLAWCLLREPSERAPETPAPGETPAA